MKSQYYPLNANGEAKVVEPHFVPEAESGDIRVTAKTVRRADTATQDDLKKSIYDFYVYKTNVASIPIIRNEELVLLLYAEVQAQLNNTAEAIKGN